ncbi:uncharacterized protein LOC144726635 isoform X3 [Lampetra planeri]
MRGGHGRAERPTQRGGGGGADSMVPARKCFFLLLALMTLAASPSPVAGKLPGRPIVWCRTVDMLTLTCWWQPAKGDDPSTNYTLFYTTQSGSTLANESAECPDYVTAGPNSCFFDQEHTSMWVMHCVTVMASSPTGNASFEKHCIKLLDYVEPDVPVNVNVTLRNVSDPDPVVLVTWAPPPSANVKYGLVVLEYEVEYRAEHQTSGTKTFGIQTTELVLHGLKPGERYYIRVRCRATSSPFWSPWSAEVEIQPPIGINQVAQWAVGVTLLAAVMGAMVTLLFLVTLIGTRKRIKRVFLPPVPGPRITGMDHDLLKKTPPEELHGIFALFHSYTPARCEDTDSWAECVEVGLEGTRESRGHDINGECGTGEGGRLLGKARRVRGGEESEEDEEDEEALDSGHESSASADGRKGVGSLPSRLGLDSMLLLRVKATATAFTAVQVKGPSQEKTKHAGVSSEQVSGTDFTRELGAGESPKFVAPPQQGPSGHCGFGAVAVCSADRSAVGRCTDPNGKNANEPVGMRSGLLDVYAHVTDIKADGSILLQKTASEPPVPSGKGSPEEHGPMAPAVPSASALLPYVQIPLHSEAAAAAAAEPGNSPDEQRVAQEMPSIPLCYDTACNPHSASTSRGSPLMGGYVSSEQLGVFQGQPMGLHG